MLKLAQQESRTATGTAQLHLHTWEHKGHMNPHMWRLTMQSGCQIRWSRPQCHYKCRALGVALHWSRNEWRQRCQGSHENQFLGCTLFIACPQWHTYDPESNSRIGSRQASRILYKTHQAKQGYIIQTRGNSQAGLASQPAATARGARRDERGAGAGELGAEPARPNSFGARNRFRAPKPSSGQTPFLRVRRLPPPPVRPIRAQRRQARGKRAATCRWIASLRPEPSGPPGACAIRVGIGPGGRWARRASCARGGPNGLRPGPAPGSRPHISRIPFTSNRKDAGWHQLELGKGNLPAEIPVVRGPLPAPPPGRPDWWPPSWPSARESLHAVKRRPSGERKPRARGFGSGQRSAVRPGAAVRSALRLSVMRRTPKQPQITSGRSSPREQATKLTQSIFFNLQ